MSSLCVRHCVQIMVLCLSLKLSPFGRENSNNMLCTGTFEFGLVVYQEHTE